MLRWLTAGESHGPALVAVLEGLPAGVHVTSGDVAAALARRRLGFGRGGRMVFERDEVEFLGGLRHGVTLGSPVAIRIGNTEWPKWETVMSADPVDPALLEGRARNAPLTRPRPGYADLVGQLLDPLVRLVCRDTPEPRMHLEVAAAGEAFVHHRFLKDDAADLARRERLGGDVEAGEASFAGRGLDSGREHPDGGRLARAVRSEQAEHLARLHGEADVLHGLHVGRIGLGEVVDLDRGLRRFSGAGRHGCESGLHGVVSLVCAVT